MPRWPISACRCRPVFTITSEVCTHYYENGNSYPKDLEQKVAAALAQVGRITGKVFGDPGNPLLVSVRSGARASMPGMMDTVLNLGLNDETVVALAKRSGDKRFAYDHIAGSSRCIPTWCSASPTTTSRKFSTTTRTGTATRSTPSFRRRLGALVGRYKERLEEEHGEPFPQDPHKQLWGAIGAVFGSWMNQRAITYRRLHNIPESWGTAVNVQAMVFGNMGETSATGVAFTRNPSTGEKQLYGEFLINAQGEDVVAGIRTPQEITEAARQESGSDKPSMEMAMPAAFKELTRIYGVLERHYRDMQDLEFTVEQDKLWMLQTRSGKRTAKAALKIAVELANEGLITRKEAITRIDPAGLDQLLHPTIDPNAERKVIATTTRRSGSGTGSVRSRRLLTREKIAVLAPMPRASDRIAMPVTTGAARSTRTATRRSCTGPPGDARQQPLWQISIFPAFRRPLDRAGRDCGGSSWVRAGCCVIDCRQESPNRCARRLTRAAVTGNYYPDVD